MLHTIIDEYDIFFNSQVPQFCERKSGSGIMTSVMENGKYKPYSFFSTNPADYLKKENQV